jgi:putative hydrolase of the HAD superfamily
MIRTIIFDLGKVIVPFDFARSYDRMAPLCNLTHEQMRERLWGCDLVWRYETGQIESRDFVQKVGNLLGFQPDFEQFCDMFTSIFLPDTLLPDSFVGALGERYRLVLLSNTNEIHFNMIERTYPILRHFDEFVLSHRVGATKPDPKIYEAAIAAAQCRPEECFFTDDIPAYIEGAKAAGIDAVQFENHEQIERELRARGLEW